MTPPLNRFYPNQQLLTGGNNYSLEAHETYEPFSSSHTLYSGTFSLSPDLSQLESRINHYRQLFQNVTPRKNSKYFNILTRTPGPNQTSIYERLQNSDLSLSPEFWQAIATIGHVPSEDPVRVLEDTLIQHLEETAELTPPTPQEIQEARRRGSFIMGGRLISEETSLLAMIVIQSLKLINSPEAGRAFQRIQNHPRFFISEAEVAFYQKNPLRVYVNDEGFASVVERSFRAIGFQEYYEIFLASMGLHEIPWLVTSPSYIAEPFNDENRPETLRNIGSLQGLGYFLGPLWGSLATYGISQLNSED